MSWWIGTVFGPLANLVDAVWVEADDEPAAAQEIVARFASEEGHAALGPDEIEIDKVFVVHAETYAVYDVGLRAIGRSQFQCCGGNSWTADGHSGHCPLRRAADE